MRLWPVLAALLSLALGGHAHAEPPIRVVASFSILADLVRTIGGDRVAVRSLVGPDGDAHVYQPSPADAAALAGARLFVINGLGFEGWTVRLTQASGFAGRTVVASAGIEPAAGAAAMDPHGWQDVALAERYVGTIEQALEAADPAGAEAYRAALAAERRSLDALDRWVRGEIATVPPERRVMVTTHDAFGRFGQAYGVRVLAPIGPDEASEPAPATIARLVGVIRREHVRALFLENQADPRLIAALAREAGVTPSGTLYADALSGPAGPAPTYDALMRHNVETMVAAMRGD